MNRPLRIALLIAAVVQIIVGIAFALQVPAVVDLWHTILPAATPFSLMFVGSIFTAAGVSTLWALAVLREDNLLTGIALDYLTIMIPVSIFSFQIAGAENNSSLFIFAIICLLAAIGGVVIFLLTRKLPNRNTQPQPNVVRISFGIILIALFIVGGAMILKVPNVMPWSISTSESVIYGWMLIGAAAYFIYSLLRPSWENSAGQLAGFLAYDLVLLVPFITRFGTTIPPQFMLGHIIYTVVVVYSAVLAIYYLFINPTTRLSRQAK